jgi:hypothetical protein
MMRNFLKNSLFIFAVLFLCGTASAQNSQELIFASTSRQANLMEVYVSQGCSSCPPAQDWINKFVDSPRLWKDVIPVVFHVDYWDYLGWKDIFGSPVYTGRQAEYKDKGGIRSVYTPGFVVNGKEWQGWGENKALSENNPKANILEAKLKSGRLSVSYSGAKEPLSLNIAILGFGLETKVAVGENSGRQLREEFVVLAFENRLSENNSWQIALPQNLSAKAKRYALVLWVSKKNRLSPLQAAGTWL